MGQLCERFDEDIYAAFPFQRWSKGIYPEIVEGSFMRRPQNVRTRAASSRGNLSFSKE